MSDNYDFEAWHSALREQAKKEALTIAIGQCDEPQVWDFSGIRTIYSEQWHKKLERVYQRAIDAHPNTFRSLLLIACRYAVYAPERASRSMIAMCAGYEDGYFDNPLGVEKDLLTAEGYAKHEGLAYTIHDALSELSQPREMLEGTGLQETPEVSDILEALAIHWYCLACTEMDSSKSMSRIYEIADALELANGYSMWKSAEELANEARRNAGRAGALQRHLPMQNLREWALEKYKEGSWKSANAASFELMSKVLEHGKKIGAHLSPANAQRTIAEWIRKSS